jgi:acyl carrier protein
MIKMARAIGEVSDDVYAAVRELAGDVALDKDTILADLLEKEHDDDSRLEHLVMFLEDKYGVTLADKEIQRAFRYGTLGDLAVDLSGHLMAKEADMKRFKRHQNYYRHRHQAAIKRKQYRMSHLHQERRRGRIYRRKVKRGQIRPATRFGNKQTGYSFVGGFGSKRGRR